MHLFASLTEQHLMATNGFQLSTASKLHTNARFQFQLIAINAVDAMSLNCGKIPK